MKNKLLLPEIDEDLIVWCGVKDLEELGFGMKKKSIILARKFICHAKVAVCFGLDFLLENSLFYGRWWWELVGIHKTSKCA